MRRTTSTRRAVRALVAVVACGATVAGPAAAAGPPTATTLPPDPTLITDSYALLSGELNPQGFNVVYRFQWGRTTAYGKTTPITQGGNGKAPVPVDVSLDRTDGLKPNTRYHYRLVVSPVKPDGDFTYLGDIAGADETFRTAPRLGVRFKGARARVVDKRANVALRAVGPAGEAARGKLTLRAKLAKKTRKIGTASYRIRVGKTKRVAVKLSAKARKALAAGGRLKATGAAKTKGTKKPVTHHLVLKG